MSNYRPIDSKREEFRKYLERAGVMDALTKVLVSLYEEVEKPDDALDYVRKHLSGGAEGEDAEDMKTELEGCKSKIEELEQANADLKERLIKYEPDAEGEQPPEGDQPPPEEGEPPAEEPAPAEEE